MYERKRQAIDVAGQRVELIERQESSVVEASNGHLVYEAPAKFFTADN